MNKFVLIGCMFACFALTASASIQCDGCKTIVSLIEGWAKEGKTHDEILQLVINICGILGVNYKDVCTMGVDGWLETILADLTVKTPEQVCISTLHLCENTTAVTALKGETTCADLPYEVIQNYDLYVNSTALAALNIELPAELASTAVEVG